MAWFKRQWNNPGLHEYYLMGVMAEIRSIFKSGVKLEDVRLKFTEKASRPEFEMTPEEESAYFKSVLMERHGVKLTVNMPERESE